MTDARIRLRLWRERQRPKICYNPPPEIMCGIVGYVGRAEAAPILLNGLRRLEYRGYDSAGVAIVNGKQFETPSRAGRIVNLAKLMTEKRQYVQYGTRQR